MFAILSIGIGISAIFFVNYLVYWEEKRILFHVIPYFLGGVSLLFFSIEYQKVDWIANLVFLGIIAGIHILSLGSNNEK